MDAEFGFSHPDRRSGLGGVEVIIIVAIVGFLILCVLVVLPRGRETSRMATCQRNLMQIGVATQLYEQANRHYPTMPAFGASDAGDSPIHAMLKALTIPDFLNLRNPTDPPKPTEAPGQGARVAGLVCLSDPNATLNVTGTTLSYRGNVGDTTLGTSGPFSPEVQVSLTLVEAADGLSFTAGFAERLVGTGRDGEPGPMNYAVVPGPVATPFEPQASASLRWKGDAGSSWAAPGWESAVYSHAARPNAPASSIADDAKTATISASSAHPGRINVWMLDGSLRGVTPTVDLTIWQAMGSIGSSSPTPIPVR